MKAEPKLHICPIHHEGCRKRWYEVSVENEPIYIECEPCIQKDCEDERESLSDLD